MDWSQMAKTYFWRHWRDGKLCLWGIHLVGLGFYNEKDYHVADETMYNARKRVFFKKALF